MPRHKPPTGDVLYGGLPAPTGSRVVDRLTPFRVSTRGHALVSVVEDTYTQMLEVEMGVLPPGTVVQKYQAGNPRLVGPFVQRAERHMRLGSRFAVIADPTKSGRLLGYVKTTPLEAAYPEFDRPGCYVNDIIVRPEAQGMGLGRMLLHAGLKFGGYDPGLPVVLEGYDGSPVNEWYRNLGFQMGGASEPTVIGGIELPMHFYSTEASGIALAGLVAELEDRVPALSDGYAV